MNEYKDICKLLNSRMNRMGTSQKALYKAQPTRAKQRIDKMKRSIGLLVLGLGLQACSTSKFESVRYRGIASDGSEIRVGERGTVEQKTLSQSEHDAYLLALERQRRLFELQRMMDQEHDRNFQLGVQQLMQSSQFFDSLRTNK